MTTFADQMTANWPVMLTTYGEPGTFAVSGSPTGVAVVVIVDKQAEKQEVKGWSEDVVSTVVVKVSAVAVAEVGKGDTFTVDGVAYVVLEADKTDGAVWRATCKRRETVAVGNVRRGM
jgi:hypothetical protein